MRAIKFRAWIPAQQKMFSCEQMVADQMQMLPDGRFANISSVDPRLSVIIPTDKMIPMQFTGILDRNGKEIYEGDISREMDEQEIGDEYTYFVCVWLSEWSRFAWLGMDEHNEYPVTGVEHFDETMQNTYGVFAEESTSYCVVGNIYQNPEMLMYGYGEDKYIEEND